MTFDREAAVASALTLPGAAQARSTADDQAGVAPPPSITASGASAVASERRDRGGTVVALPAAAFWKD